MVGWTKTILLEGVILAEDPAETTPASYLARLLGGKGGSTHPAPEPHQGRCQEGGNVGEYTMPSGPLQTIQGTFGAAMRSFLLARRQQGDNIPRRNH